MPNLDRSLPAFGGRGKQTCGFLWHNRFGVQELSNYRPRTVVQNHLRRPCNLREDAKLGDKLLENPRDVRRWQS
jgi:hypothetical protein